MAKIVNHLPATLMTSPKFFNVKKIHCRPRFFFNAFTATEARGVSEDG